MIRDLVTKVKKYRGKEIRISLPFVLEIRVVLNLFFNHGDREAQRNTE